MKAIITVDVSEHQIGQEVSVYFKDTMCVKGTCESEAEVYAKHDEEVIKETVESIWDKPPYTEVLDKIKAEIENDWQLRDFPASPFSCGLRRAIEIIDKYKKGDKE